MPKNQHSLQRGSKREQSLGRWSGLYTVCTQYVILCSFSRIVKHSLATILISAVSIKFTYLLASVEVKAHDLV